MDDKEITYRYFRSSEIMPNGKKIYDQHGAVMAACRTFPSEKRVAVGFSFLNPTDQMHLVRGKGIAKSRLQKQPIILENVEVSEKGKLQISKALARYLTETDPTDFPDRFGIQEYTGKKTPGIMSWLPEFLCRISVED